MGSIATMTGTHTHAGYFATYSVQQHFTKYWITITCLGQVHRLSRPMLSNKNKDIIVEIFGQKKIVKNST